MEWYFGKSLKKLIKYTQIGFQEWFFYLIARTLNLFLPTKLTFPFPLSSLQKHHFDFIYTSQGASWVKIGNSLFRSRPWHQFHMTRQEANKASVLWTIQLLVWKIPKKLSKYTQIVLQEWFFIQLQGHWTFLPTKSTFLNFFHITCWRNFHAAVWNF